MPILYVIAGPNGAGKSTYSAVLVPKGTEVFDGDKELAIFPFPYVLSFLMRNE